MKRKTSLFKFILKMIAVVFTAAFFLFPAKQVLAADSDMIRIGLTGVSDETVKIGNKKISIGYSADNKFTPVLSITSSKGFKVQPFENRYSLVKKKYGTIAEASDTAAAISALGYSSHILIDNSEYFKVAVSSASENNLRKAADRLTSVLKLEFAGIYKPDSEIHLSGINTSVIFSMNKKYGMPQIACSKKDASYPFVKFTDTSYRGRIEFTRENKNGASDKKLTVVNIVPLESYLMSVVPSEMFHYWPEEALKAQAVCARSYAVCHTEFGSDYNFEKLYCMDDTSGFQSYRGAEMETEETTSAVKATKGECIYSDGRPVNSFYFSSSGGATEDIYNVWGIKDSVFKSIPDFYEKEEDCSIWSRTYSAEQLENMLFSKGYTDSEVKLENIIISKSTESGRVLKLKLKTNGGKIISITREACRTVFSLPSAMYTITKYKSGGVKYITFSGRGSGHGVGMPQSGAKGMAEEGYSYRDIIEYYYSNVEVR